MAKKRFWKDWYTKKYTFYFGFFPEKDYRLGWTLGNREGSIDLFVCTLGYMKDY